MISHPFEIQPSAAGQGPDVLMVTWRGTPAQSVAEIYLPAVPAQAVIALADTMYGRHRMTATDAHTIQFPGSDLTLIPVPAGTGRYAGLLSVEVHPSMPEGRSFTAAVRQLHQASVTDRKPPPPPPAPQAVLADAAAESSKQEAFSWREVQGAFQYTVTVRPEAALRPEQERLVAWLKWRFATIPAKNRWKPVLQRYLKYTEDLVWSLGRDPNTIPPSDTGRVPGEGPGPEFPVVPGRKHQATGKVVAIDYDRFGDFSGFAILTETGAERLFRAAEHAIENLVREAWAERSAVRVFSDERDPERVDHLVLLRRH
jgi:hypothetical protein